MSNKNFEIVPDYDQLQTEDAQELFLKRVGVAGAKRDAARAMAKLERIRSTADRAMDKIARGCAIAGVGVALVMLGGCDGNGEGRREQIDVISSSPNASHGVGGCKDGMCRLNQ